MLLGAVACATEGAQGRAEALPSRITASVELGSSDPFDGKIVEDGDPGLAGALAGSYRLTNNIGVQLMFSGLSTVEEEEDAVFGFMFGDYRQETQIYGITLGPRFAWPISLDPGKEKGRPFIEVFVDAGFGGYFTVMEVNFPRGRHRAEIPNPDVQASEKDRTSDLGINSGVGFMIRLADGLYLGAAVRSHLIFFRPEKDERFMGESGDTFYEGVYADSGGGRSEELIFLQNSILLAYRF